MYNGNVNKLYVKFLSPGSLRVLSSAIQWPSKFFVMCSETQAAGNLVCKHFFTQKLQLVSMYDLLQWYTRNVNLKRQEFGNGFDLKTELSVPDPQDLVWTM